MQWCISYLHRGISTYVLWFTQCNIYVHVSPYLWRVSTVDVCFSKVCLCACLSLSLPPCIFSLSLGAETFFGTPGLSYRIYELPFPPTEVVLGPVLSNLALGPVSSNLVLGTVSSNLVLGPILYHQVLKMTCTIEFDLWAFGAILWIFFHSLMHYWIPFHLKRSMTSLKGHC